ncbi:hypothetical protein [Streptomyces cyaneogriseus]|nr:hypothetical protein [Streptomyces cyaneogriseus]
MSVPAAPRSTAPPGQPKKAATAAWIGSALEYYDFSNPSLRVIA